MNGRKSQGFTLIELLVTVAIIAMLAATMVPALSRAKSYSQTATCMNNLKQFGAATLMYSDDYDGYVPRDYTPEHVYDGRKPLLPEIAADYLLIGSFPLLPADVDPILNGGGRNDRDQLLAIIFSEHPILQCPSFPRISDSFTATHPTTSESVTISRQTWTYAINAWEFTNIEDEGSSYVGVTKLIQVDDQARYVYLIDANSDASIRRFDLHDVWSTSHLWSGGGPRMIEDSRHLMKGNASYFDGHVESHKYHEFGKADFTDK